MHNQSLITSSTFGDASYDDPIFAFQKAAWVLIHDYDAGYYTDSFDSADLAALIERDAAIENSVVADLLLSSAIYNANGAGQIFFGEAANPEDGLQGIMLISAVPVPEPSGAILLIASAGIWMLRRRQR